MWGYLDEPRLCFVLWCCSWVSCLFWTEHCPPGPADSSVFQHLLHIWTLSSSDCMIVRSIFSHRGQLRDSNTTIKKGSNIHWCSRRKHDALRAGGENFWTGWRCPNFSYFVEISFFSIYYCTSEATEATCMFPRRQVKYNLPDLQIQKVFTPRLLMHRVFFWSISECLNLF